MRICLPMQGTRVHPWSEKTPHTEEQLSVCATTTESTCHNCWPRALQPTALELQTRPACSKTCAPQQEATTVRGPCTCPVMKSSPHSPQLQKSPWSSEDPAWTNIKKKKKERKKERKISCSRPDLGSDWSFDSKPSWSQSFHHTALSYRFLRWTQPDLTFQRG